jgi:hypothetical protein
MGLNPVEFHPMTTRRPQDFVSGTFVIEGTVVSKRTYAKGGSVQNEVTLKLVKVLRGEGLAGGTTMSVHVLGGYTPGTSSYADHPEQQRPVCLEDTVNDGGRIEAGKLYLVAADKDTELGDYRSFGTGTWVEIQNDHSLAPLSPRLVHELSGKKVEDLEEIAKRTR